MMRYKRYKLSRRYNSRQFSRVARRVHKKNLGKKINRGGIRL